MTRCQKPKLPGEAVAAPAAAATGAAGVTVEVSRDLSGGVKIRMGDKATILSPQQAVQFATGILKSAGVGVEMKRGEAVSSLVGRLS